MNTSETTETTETKKRTVTLTGRPPVKFVESDWPLIASSDYLDHDGEVRSQANRVTDVKFRVRRHADGRVIVYGVYSYSSAWQNERDQEARAGYLLAAGDDVIAAIERVGQDLADLAPHPAYSGLVADCIGDLPAEEI